MRAHVILINREGVMLLMSFVGLDLMTYQSVFELDYHEVVILEVLCC